VLLETRIDALDLTVLKGGGADVAEWAHQHGFRLSPDAPEVLDFYAERSPIFLAAVFDGDAARERGQAIGDGTPVHLTIPLDSPWVPLRILGLGKQPTDFIDADVFLLTDAKPALLPAPSRELFSARASRQLSLSHSAPASVRLLDDLRSDVGMGWVPQTAWLTEVGIGGRVSDIQFDLAIDPTGTATPSAIAAGLERPAPAGSSEPEEPIAPVAATVTLVAAVTGFRAFRRSA